MNNDTDLAKTIALFGHPSSKQPIFHIDDSLAVFEGRPGTSLYLPEPDYDALFKAYGLKPSDFRERVANLVNPSALENMSDRPLYEIKKPLHVNWVTSADVKAENEGTIRSDQFAQLAAIGMTVTGDGYLVLGVRGGDITPKRREQYASGLLGPVPGGSVTFKPQYDVNPIVDTLVGEFREEVGNFDLKQVGIIGICDAHRPGPTGIKFVGVLRTDATLRQIQHTNEMANGYYREIIRRGGSKRDTKEELQMRELPTDAWEHRPIMGIADSCSSIRALLETQSHNLSGIVAGALQVYDNHLQLENC